MASQKKELANMKYLAEKFGEKDLTVLGQFSYDIQEPETKTNKDIAHSLNKLGYLDS